MQNSSASIDRLVFDRVGDTDLEVPTNVAATANVSELTITWDPVDRAPKEQLPGTSQAPGPCGTGDSGKQATDRFSEATNRLTEGENRPGR